MERLNNKIGLITGAASGIGLATCELLLQNGATIIMSDLSNSASRQKANQAAIFKITFYNKVFSIAIFEAYISV